LFRLKVIYFRLIDAGGSHLFTYKGKRENNFEDIEDFQLTFPTLEYRNKTCSWLEVFMMIRKDVTKTLLKHTGSLVREKFRQFRNLKWSSTPNLNKKKKEEDTKKKDEEGKSIGGSIQFEDDDSSKGEKIRFL
jgi:hypothetical protein